MVNTRQPNVVHLDQLNARKRKSPPRDEDGPCGADSLCGVRPAPGPNRRLSIDVAAAAAAVTSRCYREDAVGMACSTPSSSLASSSRPLKCLRLTALPPASPTSPTERLRRKHRLKELASKRRFFRLYNKRIATPYTLHFPFAGLNYDAQAPLPAHTLGHPATCLSSSAPDSPSSLVDSPTTPLSTTFGHNLPSSGAGLISASRGPITEPGPPRSCFHQSCVAFRFASMIDGVHLSSLTSQRGFLNQNDRVGSFYVPPILPPINRYTLQELDLDAIMKNPQLRHDLLFDVGLQFRPTDSKRKRETTDMYWCTIKSELEAGCACVSFDDMRHMHRHACRCPENTHNASCYAKVENEHPPCEDALPVRVPSRIGPLIDELCEVILAVVKPPPLPIPIRAGTLEINAPHIVLRPRRFSVSDEASILWLREAFDVPLIEQQLRHGIFDPVKLLVAVSKLLREHCAPARDSMVDTMLDIARKCSPGKGGHLVDTLAAIRMCFELLELMRLDLANHLLANLRPHLLASAPQFEVLLFDRRLDLDVPVTRTWISSTYAKISSSSDLHDAVGTILPPPERVRLLPPIQKIVATVLSALVDLVVFPPNPTSATLPPSPTTTPVTKGRHTYQVSVQPGYPETLYLDHSRLLMLTADAADITASAMFLALFRQLSFSSSPKVGARTSVSDDDLARLKREIAAVGPPRPGVCFCREYSLDDDITRAQNPSLVHWRNAMSSVALHLAHTIEKSRLQSTKPRDADACSEEGGSSFRSPAAPFTPPDAELVKSVTDWCKTNMHAGSVVSLVFRKKVAAAVLKALIPRFSAVWNAVVRQRLGKGQSIFATEKSETAGERKDDAAKVKTGLEPLSEEIDILTERLAKLAVLHLRVYFPFYDQSGFLTDSNDKK
ncbi:hypothetical protein M0805_000145 [Coniferiporia weirii]|nr:hypothetical protein M0805_000145 [Coniferiporia weirii]